MSKFKKDFEYILQDTITVQDQIKGEIKSNILKLSAPANRHQKNLSNLRKMLVTAIMRAGQQSNSNVQNKSKEKDVELDGSAMLIILYGSNIDMTEYKDLFWDMILDDLCLIDNSVKLTKDILNDIYHEEQEVIVGEYTVNFIMPSWMKKQLKM